MDYFGGKPATKPRKPSAYNMFVKQFATECRQSGKTFTIYDAAAAWKASASYVLPKSAGTLCKGLEQRDCPHGKSRSINGKPCVWTTPKKANKKTGKVARPHCRSSPFSK